MTDKKVSELLPASVVNLADYLLLVQAGNSLKIDVETLALKMPSRIIVNEASEALIASGAIATNKLVTKLKALTAGGAYTLAAGTHGMEKQIVCDVADLTTPSAVITVTGGAGFTTITMNALGDSVYLKNINGVWYILGSNSVVIA